MFASPLVPLHFVHNPHIFVRLLTAAVDCIDWVRFSLLSYQNIHQITAGSRLTVQCHQFLQSLNGSLRSRLILLLLQLGLLTLYFTLPLLPPAKSFNNLDTLFLVQSRQDLYSAQEPAWLERSRGYQANLKTSVLKLVHLTVTFVHNICTEEQAACCSMCCDNTSTSSIFTVQLLSLPK